MPFSMRKLVVPFAMAVSLVALAGCSAGAAPANTTNAKTIKIAALTPNTSDPVFQTMSCGIAAEAKKVGATLSTFNTTSTDSTTIAGNFQTAILTNPDAVIVTPFNNNQFVAQYKQLMTKGVPVATNNGTKPQVDYKYISSSTDTAAFSSKVEGLISKGNGSMVFLGGAPGIPPLVSRTQPFVDAVEKSQGRLKPLPIEYSGFDINKATSDTASLIIAHPDLKLIIAADGQDAQGAAAAIKQAGKAGKIALIAFDATPPEVDSLKAGIITALIAQDPYQIGTQLVDSVVDYLKNHSSGSPVSPAGAATVGNALLTKDNVTSPENAKYLYKTSC